MLFDVFPGKLWAFCFKEGRRRYAAQFFQASYTAAMFFGNVPVNAAVRILETDVILSGKHAGKFMILHRKGRKHILFRKRRACLAGEPWKFLLRTGLYSVATGRRSILVTYS